MKKGGGFLLKNKEKPHFSGKKFEKIQEKIPKNSQRLKFVKQVVYVTKLRLWIFKGSTMGYEVPESAF